MKCSMSFSKAGADWLDNGEGLPKQLMHNNCISHHEKDDCWTQAQEMGLFERFTRNNRTPSLLATGDKVPGVLVKRYPLISGLGLHI